MRRQCFVLAANSSTPLPYWLSIPLLQLPQWIETNNEIYDKTGKEGG